MDEPNETIGVLAYAFGTLLDGVDEFVLPPGNVVNLPTVVDVGEVTIIDDDVRGLTVSPSSLEIGESGSGSYTVALNTQPTGDVTVEVSRSGSSDVSASPSSLTFTSSNWSTAQTVSVSAGHDDDAADDTVALTNTPSGADYEGVSAASVSVTVDDGAPDAPAGLSASAGDGQVALSWSDPRNSSISKYQHRNKAGSGAFGSWADIPGSGSGATSHTVTGLANGTAYTFEVRAVNASGKGPAASATATPKPTRAVVVTPALLAIDEGGSGSYTVVLNSQPTGDVTVTVTSDNTDVSASPSSLTFTSSNWSTAQAVSVSAGQDNDAADDTASLTNTPSGADYGGVPAVPVSVTVTDDDLGIPVCNRTAQVRDALVAASPVSACGAVTRKHLAAITSLSLRNKGISTLQPGDFSGLTALTTLDLSYNALTTLPVGVFVDLSALTTVNLSRNALTALTSGAFYGLTALTALDLSHNALATLPAGIFYGLPALPMLSLENNAINPLPLTVSLEKVGDDRFKAVAAAGAPFSMVLPVSVSGGGSIDGGAASVTIAAGALESSTLTVSRTAGATAKVTADIGALPNPPANHGGYVLAKSADLPLEVLAELAPGISVGDARVQEGSGKTVDFAVSLGHASSATVTVAYATADGSAVSGQDYTSVSGTLTFSAGETVKTVSVPVLDDAVDEGEETFTLNLSNATGARIEDGQATGTIANSDPLPQAWLARFGRTVAGHVTEALSERLTQTGHAPSQFTLGGVPLPLREDVWPSTRQPGFGAGPDAGMGYPARPGRFAHAPDAAAWYSEPLAAHPASSGDRTLRDWLLGSSFRATLKRDEDNPAGSRWTAWGNGMASRFDGIADGLDVNGEVTTLTLGADRAWDRWLAGVAFASSSGSGGFADRSAGAGSPGRGSGDLNSTMTSVHPYVRFGLSERLSAWGLLGYGRGELTLGREDSGIWRTDTAMRMAAAGVRGVVAPAAFTGGLEWAVRSDVLFTQMTSEAVEMAAGRLAGSEGGTSRLRLVLEGSRTWTLQRSRTVTPSVELGLKHDGGDAETGMGVEIGGGLRFVDPGMGLILEVGARGLLAHRESYYREWGASATLRVDPGASGRGLVLALTPSWGVDSSGVERLWSLRDARGLTRSGDFTPAGRLEAELGYMLDGPRGRGVQAPYAALSLGDAGDRTLRLGWRLAIGTDSALRLEGMRRRPASGNPAELGILLRGSARW